MNNVVHQLVANFVCQNIVANISLGMYCFLKVILCHNSNN